MNLRKLLLLACFIAGSSVCSVVCAQTNVTSKIANPSFESNGLASWTQSGLWTQTNSAFGNVSGSVYVEKWVSSGSAVGDASLSQSLTGLANGTYTLTVAGQNIQQSDETASQTGCYVVANGNQTLITTAGDYSVNFTVLNGTATIGVNATGASGNWLAFDNFRLYRNSTAAADVLPALQTVVNEAKTYQSQNMTSSALSTLNSAISAAESLISKNSITNLTTVYNNLVAAIATAQEGIIQYKYDNATEANPVDMTSFIYNPSFEIYGWQGWTCENMQIQTNTAFSMKESLTYVEKWVASGSLVGNGSIKQTVAEIPNGVYILTVAAQNIQQNSSASQTGAYIFANNSRTDVHSIADYQVRFTSYTGSVELGFNAVSSTGNWMGCDNFRLVLVSNSFSDIKAGFQSDIDAATALLSHDMDSSVKASLQTAVNNASAKLTATDSGEFATVGVALQTAYAAALASVEKYELLAKVAASTGTAPTVVTDTRYARGCTMAFGRSTVSGSNIIEQGFCWSTEKNPTIADERTIEYISNNGNIYWMKNLTPATIYYARAYAMTSDYAVGYGDVIKIVTIPQGDIHWSYGYEGDDAINARIVSALTTAFDTYWDNLTQINNFYPSIHYASGTPTADCSYGGWMRVGPNTSYQAPGTIMHEALHGIGVGTHWIWSNSFMRANTTGGYWLGDRVTSVLRFWDNSTDGMLNGDATHMWPYGINGAHEDNGTALLYLANGLIAEALGEDGLPPTGGFGLPHYCFDQENTYTYYITNEDANHGRETSYLVEENGKLVWKALTSDQLEVASNNAKWYITFTPSNQYYQFRNATTGKYITYSASYATDGYTLAQSSAGDINFHMMMGRNDVTLTDGTVTRGYWLTHPEGVLSPQAFVALDNNTTGTAMFDLTDEATAQRWIFLFASDETEADQNPAEGNGYDITNAMAPYLSTADLSGWTNNGMANSPWGSYSNSTDGAVVDYPFFEKWTASGSLADASVSQTITGLPNGQYYIGGSFISTLQSDASVSVTGASFFAQNSSIEVATADGMPEVYSLLVDVTDGTLTYGFKTQGTSANWVAMDNFFLKWAGTEEEYIANATVDTPVRIVISNPRMEGSTSGWTTTGNTSGSTDVWQMQSASYSNFNPTFMESWVPSTSTQTDKSAYQTMNLPQGLYRFQAAVNAVKQNSTETSSGCSIFIDDEATVCSTGDGAPEIFTVDAILEEGEHSFGVKLESANFNWFAWDNAVLYYYGPYEEPLETVTLADNSYATFSSSKSLDFSDVDDVRAFIAVGYSGGKLFLTSVKKVPAGTGILLRGNEGTYEIPEVEGTTDDVSDNMLVGVTETTTVSTLSGDYANYYFVKENGVAYFNVVTSTQTIEAGNAYLRVPATMSVGAKKISIMGDDSATAIEAVETDSDNEAYYTLTGIKVSKPAKGVFIHGGKKVYVK